MASLGSLDNRQLYLSRQASLRRSKRKPSGFGGSKYIPLFKFPVPVTHVCINPPKEKITAKTIPSDNLSILDDFLLVSFYVYIIPS